MSSAYNYHSIVALMSKDQQQNYDDAGIRSLLSQYHVAGHNLEILEIIRIVTVELIIVFVVLSSPIQAKSLQSQFQSPVWSAHTFEEDSIFRRKFDLITKDAPSILTRSKSSGLLSSRKSSFTTIGGSYSSPLHDNPSTDSPVIQPRSVPIRYCRDEISTLELTDTLAGRLVQPPRPIDRVLCLTPSAAAVIPSSDQTSDTYDSDRRIQELLHGCGNIEFITRWQPFKSQSPFLRIYVTFKTAKEAEDALKKFTHLDWEVQSIDSKLAAEYSWSLRRESSFVPEPKSPILLTIPDSLLNGTVISHDPSTTLPSSKGTKSQGSSSLKAKSPSPTSRQINPLKRPTESSTTFQLPPRPKKFRVHLGPLSRQELEREIMDLENTVEDQASSWAKRYNVLEQELRDARREIKLQLKSPSSIPASHSSIPTPCHRCSTVGEGDSIWDKKIAAANMKVARLETDLEHEKSKRHAAEEQLDRLRIANELGKSYHALPEKELGTSQPTIKNLEMLANLLEPEMPRGSSNGPQMCPDDTRNQWQTAAPGKTITRRLPTPASSSSSFLATEADAQQETLTGGSVSTPLIPRVSPVRKPDEDIDLESMDESDG